MPQTSLIPLHVYQVLEEEYISLYGPIPPDDVVEVLLPADDGANESRDDGDKESRAGGAKELRAVRAARDWQFLKGHLKDPAGFAANVLHKPAPRATKGPSRWRSLVAKVLRRRSAEESSSDVLIHLYDEWARKRLREYMTGKIGPKLLADLAEPGQTSQASPLPDRVESLEKALNKLLQDEELYHCDRFPKSWLSPAAQGLATLRESGVRFEKGSDDLSHFNRLLLEDAFRKYVERIHDIRLAAICKRLHAVRPTALSLSGGGIRSGTFALGLMQGLARHDLLKQFNYLSTVSGGGYIGSWLTAWIHRHPEGLGDSKRGVTRDLANADPKSQIDPDPKPLQYLREYSNFITPKVGLLTADTWTFIGIYFRNLLLNWAVFIPLLIALLMIPRLVLTLTLWQPVEPPVKIENYFNKDKETLEGQVQGLKDVPEALRVVYRPRALSWGRNPFNPDGRLYLRDILLALGFAFGVWALGYIGFNRPAVRELLRRRRRFWREGRPVLRGGSGQGSFLFWCLLPLLLSAFLLTLYWAWLREGEDSPRWYAFLVFGGAFTFSGWLVSSIVLKRHLKRNWREIDIRELVSIVAAGVVSGILFLVASLFDLGNPVISYGAPVNGDFTALVRKPFPWVDWTSWTWSSWTTELYVCLAVPLFLLIFWAGTTLFVGLMSAGRKSDSRKFGDEDREWWARLGAWLLIAFIAWSVFNVLVIFGPLAILDSPKIVAAVGGVSGLVSILVGRSSAAPARDKANDETDRSKSGAATNLLLGALPLLGAVFLGAVVALLSLLTTGITRKVALLPVDSVTGKVSASPRAVEWLTNVPSESPYHGFEDYVGYITPKGVPPARPKPTPAIQPVGQPIYVVGGDSDNDMAAEKADDFIGAKIVHMNVLHHTSLLFTFLIAVVMGLLGLLLARLINLNYFSLHAGYRNRLIRAFLGASRPPGSRKPNPFTGFDPADNINMHELRPALFDEGDFPDPAELANKLLDNNHPLSAYLLKRGLLDNLKGKPRVASPEVIAALRADLNTVLDDGRLYAEADFKRDYLKTRSADEAVNSVLTQLTSRPPAVARPAALADVPTTSDHHLLLNRLVLEEAYPDLIAHRKCPPPPSKLLHVICTTLNLVGGDKLAWQQRKAEPFTVTPLHSGCFRVGYRRSGDYGGEGGISIGTAATASGAAASSNMGYYTTSPIISLLLTLFNVRLGLWLGNPGPAGQDTFMLDSPKFSISPVVHEAFGLTNDTYKYVYLTDGGHFENLAIYEMVLRRCHVIVISDAAADAEYKFGDLGNAVRKIRIDLGVPIEFVCFDIFSWDESRAREARGRGNPKGMYWAVGRIRYSCIDKVGVDADGKPIPVDDGILIYVKPALYGDEPRDVLDYRESFPAFPHQSTGDQFFDEPQFESYRALGSFIADQLSGAGFGSFDPMTIADLIGGAFAGALEHCPDEFGSSDADITPAAHQQKFKEWLGSMGDKSKRAWFEEMARGLRR